MSDGALLGIDIGGTHTRTVIEDVSPRGRSSVSTPSDFSASDVSDSVVAAVDRGLRRGEGRRWAAIAVGAHGLDTTAAVERTRIGISRLAPQVPVVVVNDALLLLGATNLRSGVALIAGTGSVAVAGRDTTEVARAGGWGHLLGDEGSATAIVLDAIRVCLRSADDDDEQTLVGAAVLDAFGATHPRDLIDIVGSSTPSAQIAAHAPAVFAAAEQGCSGAASILRNAADSLAAIAAAAAHRADIDGPVVMGGGVIAGQPGYAALVRAALRRRRPDGAAIVFDGDPVDGALAFARAAATPLSDPRFKGETREHQTLTRQ